MGKEKTMSDCKLLDTLSTCRCGLIRPTHIYANVHHVASVDISCDACSKHLFSHADLFVYFTVVVNEYTNLTALDKYYVYATQLYYLLL